MWDDMLYEAMRMNKKAISRLLSLIERSPLKASEMLEKVWAKKPLSNVIGVTGVSGVGKSSIIASLTKYLTSQNHSVGVIALDPSSPFTGGALLGDRVRMKGSGNKVFIRSMSTSGERALPWKALMAIEVLEGVGFNYVIVETPGAGQFNVEVMKAVDTVLVVFMPGLGDDIQALKAGLMEIGDIYVVNKADLVGADITISQIEFAISSKEINGWRPRIVKTVGLSVKGIEELIKALKDRESFLKAKDEYRVSKRASRRELEIKLFTQSIYQETFNKSLSSDKGLMKLMNEVREGSIDTITASKKIMWKLLNRDVIERLALTGKEKNI